jgi:hypothetical protein
MSSSEYVNRVREARSRTVVLKTKVFTIRSGDESTPIFIFEGKTDLGPYETWIKRIDSNLSYKGIPADGKAQVLDFRDSIRSLDEVTYSSIYFFIDYDFDGLRGYEKSENLFCTDSYSFENYLVCAPVLDSILNDEFECVTDRDSFEAVTELFSKVSSEFCDAIKEANQRLYLAAKYSLDRGRIEARVQKFVLIKIDSVTKQYDSESLSSLIPLTREPDGDQIKEGSREFSCISAPMKSYRGKYIFSFFLTWLDLLAEARRSGSPPFTAAHNIKYNRVLMSERSLASRSPLPPNLREFIAKISPSNFTTFCSNQAPGA